MSSPPLLYYGGTPVPWTVAWTFEENGGVFLDYCPHAQARALCQTDARGHGKPRFGSPHPNRQRAAIARGLCDLCGNPLRTATKISLSQARPQPHAATPGDILQVEPLLHRSCAALCLNHCPSLQRQLADGLLHIRQVFRHACQFAVYSEQGVYEACGQRVKAIAHAKVQLIAWKDRPIEYLVLPEHQKGLPLHV